MKRKPSLHSRSLQSGRLLNEMCVVTPLACCSRLSRRGAVSVLSKWEQSQRCVYKTPQSPHRPGSCPRWLQVALGGWLSTQRSSPSFGKISLCHKVCLRGPGFSRIDRNFRETASLLSMCAFSGFRGLPVKQLLVCL